MSSHTLDRHSILQTSDLEGAALNGEERCEGLEHPNRQVVGKLSILSWTGTKETNMLE